MDYQVSGMSMMMMSVALVAGILIPVVLFLVMRFKAHAKAVPFFIGCATFLLFAIVLEQIMHILVLQVSPAGNTIMNNIWLYALYGGLAAGVFEETGRFLAMKFALKKYHDDDKNALMYGAGHGGFEALCILTLGMVSNLIFAFSVNSGMIDAQLSLLPEDAKAQMIATIETMCTTHPMLFGVGILERLFAVTLHISLSVLVWFAVTGRGRSFWLYPLAVLLHALVDAVAVVANSYTNPLITELMVAVMTCLVACLACLLYKRMHKEEMPETA
jgi:uncharacterized membrane protein YhfC